MNDNLGYYADVIGIISGIMSIIGISGVLGWSFFKKGNTPFSKTVLQIFSYSVKMFFSLLLFGTLVFLLQLPWIFLVESTGGDANPNWVDGVGYVTIPFYEYLFGHGNLLGTVFLCLFFVPFYIISCACIFAWSLQPARNFIQIFSRKNIE